MRIGLSEEAIWIMISAGIGLAITRFTTLFPAPLSRPLIVFVQLGAPIGWITRVMPDGPKSVFWPGFIIDLVFWSVIAYLIISVILYFKPWNLQTGW